METSPLDTNFWNDLYQHQETRWDIGRVSDPLNAWFDQLTNKDLALLIPGCGNSHEAEYLLQQGFTNITLIDISSLLTAALEKKFSQYIGKQLTIITGDFFDLQGRFDMIIEQTFFCALLPALRPAYVEKMYSLLKPGGRLAGVLFNRSFEGGPPFGGSKEEYLSLFSSRFTIKTMEPCYNSIGPRVGAELFICLCLNHDLLDFED